MKSATYWIGLIVGVIFIALGLNYGTMPLTHPRPELPAETQKKNNIQNVSVGIISFILGIVILVKVVFKKAQ